MHTTSSFPILAAVLQWAAPAASAVLLSGGTIIAWDFETELPRVIRDGSVLVEGNTITSVEEGVPASIPDDTEIVDCTDKIITPGFIDTHRHGWQTVFKTLGSNASLTEYFDRYGEFAAQAALSADDIYISQLAGLYEAINAGVTTTLDHAHHTWSRDTSRAGLQASLDSGARVFWAYTFHEASNFTFEDQVDDWLELFSNTTSNTTEVVIAYDGWSSEDEQTETVTNLIRDNNVTVVTAHNLGGPWCYGNDPEAFQRAGVLNSSTSVVISHASFLTAEGAQLLRSTNQYISITPESEMHYGHGQPTGHLVQDQASIGVDTHFAYSTDILTQARLWLQTVRSRLYARANENWEVPANNPMSATQGFRLATRSGGLALRRPDLGALGPGARADLVVWDGRSPALLGWADPVAAVMLHASVGDIEHVLVDGVFKKRDRRLVVEGEGGYADVQDRFLASARRIQDLWRAKPLPVLEGSFDSGYSYGRLPETDVLRGQGTGYGPSYV